MNSNRKNIKYLILALFITAFLASSVFSQGIPPPPTPVLPEKPNRETRPNPRPKIYTPRSRVNRSRDETSEKSIAVNNKVTVQLCVLEGNLKVNGWDRNEVRVFVSEGSNIGFNIIEKGKQHGNPVWVEVTGNETARSQPKQSSECLHGDEIEIDVPRNSSVNVKGQESRAVIDSVRKVVIKNIGGDITVRNIAEGVEASTYEGDVTVENSSGAFTLESATGNIVAFEASPSEIGDVFKAKTSNGTIALQALEHRQIEVNSISGSISYNGELLSGGLYNFGTSNGAITLAIPTDSSCKITASYGFGVFNSEIPLKNIQKNAPSRVQNLSALMGDGGATLNLTTNSGAIRIRSKK
ncbi:MAG TPA: DUF4097 family beta strand repeat-containing protein [Pyrinomonadaceae bacterium]|jgi:hypothetical protein